MSRIYSNTIRFLHNHSHTLQTPQKRTPLHSIVFLRNIYFALYYTHRKKMLVVLQLAVEESSDLDGPS